MRRRLVLAYLALSLLYHFTSATQDYQWKYRNTFGGPSWWGVILGGAWSECSEGRMQSPINIDPQQLLFDPRLSKLYFDKLEVDLVLENTGQLVIGRISNENKAENGKEVVPIIESGPLGAYRYRLHELVLHFGNNTARLGSEHAVDGQLFPAELQLMGYNTKYSNYTEALGKPRGIVGIAVLIDIGGGTTPELRRLTERIGEITFKDSRLYLNGINPHYLLPYTEHYVTYEGSLTRPGCQEAVTWVVMNKPIFLSPEHYKAWTQLQTSARKSVDTEPQYMVDNRRPLQAANNRLLRTNINFKTKSSCILKDMYYRANAHRRRLEDAQYVQSHNWP